MSSTETIIKRATAVSAEAASACPPAAANDHGESSRTAMSTKSGARIKTFSAFYKFYLNEHSHRTNRRLHIVGTTNAAMLILTALLKRQPKLLVAALLQGYAFAWVGHFFFEKNKPATFKYPLWSFVSDWIMWYETVTLKRAF